jgi:SAM-dependent methyltransferase
MKRRSLRELINDRARKQGWYDSPEYWDMKARTYSGLARSNWPSNSYNEQVHARQMRTLDRLLGKLEGLSVAEIGCGTGRACRHLAKQGAKVTGWDFAPEALAAARRETEAEGLSASFHVGDVMAEPDKAFHRSFDVVMTLACLTLACKSRDDFEKALGHLQQLVKPGGRMLFLEPIHRSRLLRRILRLSMDEWIASCSAMGLRLLDRGGVCFVPSRLALAYFDMPRPIVKSVFAAGEGVLDAAAAFERLADYKYLVFEVPADVASQG